MSSGESQADRQPRAGNQRLPERFGRSQASDQRAGVLLPPGSDHPDSARSPPTSIGRRPRPLPLFVPEPGADVFIRLNEALSILRKVIAVETGRALAGTAGEQALRKAGQPRKSLLI